MKIRNILFFIFIIILFILNCSNNSFKNSVIYKDQDIILPMWTIYETGAPFYKSPQKGMTLDKIPFNESVEILEFRIIGNHNKNNKWFYVKWKNRIGWIEAEELSFMKPKDIKTLLKEDDWKYFNDDFTYNSKIESILESYIGSKEIEYNKITKLLIFKGEKNTKNIEYKIIKITPVMIIIGDLKSGKKYYLYSSNNPLFSEIYYKNRINVRNYVKDIHLINSRNYNGNTPLMYSILEKSDLAEIILDHEPEINCINNNGVNALALSLYDSELILELLKRGANTNIKTNDTNDNILHLYFKKNYDWELMPDFTRLFLTVGADINFRNNEGYTPLHIFGTKYDDDYPIDFFIETLKILINAGADVNAQTNDGYTCLNLISYKYKSYDLVKLLIENGADPNIKDKNNNTPLIVLLHFDLKSAELLLENGADPTIKNKDGINGITIIQDGTIRKNNFDNIIKQVILKGYELNIKNDYNETLLHYSVQRGNLELTELLIKNNFNVNSINKDGKTALHYTYYDKNGYKLVKLLLDNGAQMNQQDNYFKRTPLHFAAYSNNINLVNELLKYGADKTIKDKDGRTPAELAQYNGSGRVYPLLADK